MLNVKRMRAGLHLAFDSLFLLAAELPLNSLNTREISSDFSTAFDHNSRALSSDIELQLRHLRNFPLANKFLVAHHQSLSVRSHFLNVKSTHADKQQEEGPRWLRPRILLRNKVHCPPSSSKLSCAKLEERLLAFNISSIETGPWAPRWSPSKLAPSKRNSTSPKQSFARKFHTSTKC